MTNKRFDGQVAIITGASEGLGLGIASALAKEGALVNLIARREEPLKSAQKRITNEGGKATIYTGDITNLEAIKVIINDVYEQNGRLDLFVNNAGAWKQQTTQTPVEEIRKMQRLVYDAPSEITTFLIQKFGGAERELRILNVVSQAGWKFLTGNQGYGTAKKDLTTYMLETQGNMDFEGIRNIKLYGVYPGTFETPGVLEAIKEGKIGDATTIESVVNTTVDLLRDETPTKHAYIGFEPGKGIVRRYLVVDPSTHRTLPQHGDVQIIDAAFDPKSLVK